MNCKEQVNNRRKSNEKVSVTQEDELPTRLPNNAAGRRCMDVLYSLAKKMCADGNEATDKLIAANYPAAKTIGKNYVDRKYKRTIKWNGAHIILIYDYMTKTAAVADVPESAGGTKPPEVTT